MRSLLDFLSEVIELLNLQIIRGVGNKEETADAKDAYQWLMDETKTGKSKRAEVSKEPDFKAGKIYVFKYEAKYKNELDYWDAHPIVFVLGNMQGPSGKLMVGVNLSWYPPEARKFMVDKIRKMYKPMYDAAIKRKPMQAIDQPPVQVDLYALKTFLDDFGFSFAIRTYIPSNIRVPKICICYEDWDKAVKLDTPRVFPEIQINTPGYNLGGIYEQFKDYIKWSRNNKGEIKKRRDEAKKLNKYKFIK
jgi:hypothetical protein